MAFDNTRLPVDIEVNAQGGPSFKTTVIRFASGNEQRNQDWARVKGTWDVSYGIQDKTDYAAVRSFFYARRGRLRGFLFKDWTDFSTVAEPIGTGTGSQTIFQLIVTYTDSVSAFVRKITRPISSTLVVKVAGVTTAVTLGALGVITFAVAPANGATITADFEFDVPVRFDIDQLEITAPTAEAGEIPKIMIVELPE